jgi:hypothetical protein
MLGGSLLPSVKACSERDDAMVRFDLEINIALKQMDAGEVNAAVEGITDLIRLTLGRSRASFHVDVEPVADTCSEYETRAA